jgi:hypothetical protein
MRGNRVPPLVTTGSASDAVPGALGQPGTTILFGNSELATGAASGARFTLGFWFTRDHSLGLEGNFWFLASKTNNFIASSEGSPTLFRPFINETGAEDVQVVAVPSPTGPGLAGTVTVQSKTNLWGTGANFRSNLFCWEHCFIDGLLGFRVLGLNDDLNIDESLIYLRGARVANRSIVVPAGSTIEVGDQFKTINRFYGGNIGLDMECRRGNWIFGLKPQIGIGGTVQTVEINGNTTIGIPGQPTQNFSGGLLAQGSNIGHFSHTAFTVVPELGASIGYQLGEHWRFFVGYNVIYWSSVARAGDQIDRTVNRIQIPPPAGTADHPAILFHSTDFWAQGVNFGIEFKW